MDQDSQKESQKSRLKELITRGKEQGYLTYAEVNDHLPADITDPEQIEDIISMMNDMGIRVAEEATGMEELLLAEAEATEDEVAPEEVASALAIVDGSWDAQQIPCACICVKWGALNYSLAKAKLLSQNASKKASTRCSPHWLISHK